MDRRLFVYPALRRQRLKFFSFVTVTTSNLELAVGGGGPIGSHWEGNHPPVSPSWFPQVPPQKAAAYAARVPTARSGTIKTAASSMSSTSKKASEGQRKEGRGPSERAVQASIVGSVNSSSIAGVLAYEFQRKDRGGGDKRKQHAARRAQGRAIKTGLPSSGREAVSRPS